ncbi:MAG: flavodoxin family protein, partial [Candidatus Thorarchaeota archaeon]
MTKVLAINGSARMEKGYTRKMLNAFLEGMKEEDATIDLVYAKRLKIRPCLGDFDCWYEKVGECVQVDDMQDLYAKLRGTDILVLAIPIYLPLPGELQNLLNRLMPLVEPILEFRDGRTRAHFHDNVKISKIVLVTVGGWWEKGNADTVIRIVEEIAKDVGVEFSGALTRPHAFLLNENEEKAKLVLDAAKKAGAQLVREGKMSEELLQSVSQPLISEEDLRERYNKMYQKAKK